MQHGVDSLRRPGPQARFPAPARRSTRPAHGFRTVPGPAPAVPRDIVQQPVVALRAAARRLGTIGALSQEQEHFARTGASGIRWSPARVALRDHRRRSASPWRG